MFYPKEDITILGKKSDASLNYDIELKINDIELPSKKNTTVGKIVIKNNDKKIREVDAVIRDDLEKINFLNLFVKTFNA